MIPELSSNLSHTWFIDLDGTVFKHNEYLTGTDEILPGVQDFWSKIPANDCIVITTGRSEEYRNLTVQSLNEHRLRFNYILFDLPLGERILINDLKPNGLKTAIAINVERNKGFE